MEVFQDLTVFVPNKQLDIFTSSILEKAEQEHWKRHLNFEKDYQIGVMTDDPVFCLESPDVVVNAFSYKAYIWLKYSNEKFKVINIIPIGLRSLSYEQYNTVLDKFYKSILKPVTKELTLDIILSAPEKSVADIVGEEAYELLVRFSRLANKSTGNTHSLDFERWCDFVFSIFRSGRTLDIDVFRRFLVEDECWSNDMANKLGLDLEYALDILMKYEQSN